MGKKTASYCRKRREPKFPTNQTPTWLLFLAYLAYLRAMQPRRPPEVVIMRLLIMVTALVLIALALVAGGDASAIPAIFQNWRW